MSRSRLEGYKRLVSSRLGWWSQRLGLGRWASQSRAFTSRAHPCVNVQSGGWHLRRDGLVKFNELWMSCSHSTTGCVSRQTSQTRLKPLTHKLKWHTTHKLLSKTEVCVQPQKEVIKMCVW